MLTSDVFQTLPAQPMVDRSQSFLLVSVPADASLCALLCAFLSSFTTHQLTQLFLGLSEIILYLSQSIFSLTVTNCSVHRNTPPNVAGFHTKRGGEILPSQKFKIFHFR